VLYSDWVRGFAVPLALASFGLVGLGRAIRIGGGLQPAPLLLALCLLALAGLRLRHFFAVRAARRAGPRGAGRGAG
jgi:hypothetical protein